MTAWVTYPAEGRTGFLWVAEFSTSSPLSPLAVLLSAEYVT